MKLQVVSWNIWRGRHLEEVIAQIQRLDADIIGLQEVTIANGVNMAEVIAGELGYNVFFCQSVDAATRKPPIVLGNALLSRYKLDNRACHFLSTPEEYVQTTETEPRTAQVATIAIDSKNLTVINTHLGFSSDLQVTDMQRRQLVKLQQLITPNMQLLMGDFNSLPESDVITAIEKQLTNTDTDTSVPTRTTVKEGSETKDRIDYIFVSSDIASNNFTVHQSSASDHSPISVEIEV